MPIRRASPSVNVLQLIAPSLKAGGTKRQARRADNQDPFSIAGTAIDSKGVALSVNSAIRAQSDNALAVCPRKIGLTGRYLNRVKGLIERLGEGHAREIEPTP